MAIIQIHLLDDPSHALQELARVCRPGGKLILPTFTNETTTRGKAAAAFLSKAGVDFKRQFTLESYKAFFADAGYPDVVYQVIDGRLPCAVAIIRSLESEHELL